MIYTKIVFQKQSPELRGLYFQGMGKHESHWTDPSWKASIDESLQWLHKFVPEKGKIYDCALVNQQIDKFTEIVEELGFKKVGPETKNPNTSNRIQYFILQG